MSGERELADGTVAVLLEPGTRVRSVHNPRLTGTVRCIEWHESGKPSAIPYNIGWDDRDAASKELGSWFYIYAGANAVEPIPEDDA